MSQKFYFYFVIILILIVFGIFLYINFQNGNISISNNSNTQINQQRTQQQLITYNDFDITGISCMALKQYGYNMIQSSCMNLCKSKGHVYNNAYCNERDSLICICNP